MELTDIGRRTLKGGTAPPRHTAPAAVEPLAVRLAEAIRISGLSRSSLYRLASRGELTFLKAGSSVLVDFASLRSVIAGLPKANINIAA
jgi:hypothetical protein